MQVNFKFSFDFGFYLPRTDWEPIQVLPKMTQIVAAITSGILVGPDLCRDELWINTIINNTKDFLTAATILKFWPAWLRSTVKFTIPQIWRIWRHNKTTGRMVSAVLKHPGYEKKHVDAVHGISDMVPEDRKTDYSFQANCQLGLAAAGIHTTARMLCHVLFDLATHPEYLPILREEIYSTSKPESYVLEYFNSLKKMDSFMKESMRLHGGAIGKCHLLPFETCGIPRLMIHQLHFVAKY
jgi:cytochrome P450